MPQLELYEKKILSDEELPIQLSVQRTLEPWEITADHWHEHLELLYVLHGKSDMHIGQRSFHVSAGDFLIVNCGELHSIYCTQAPYEQNVIVFDIGTLSKELAKKNAVFRSLIQNDHTVDTLVRRIFDEREREQPGYKTLCRALTTELLVHLCRHYVVESPPEKEAERRRRALERLTPVLTYIEFHLAEHISVEQLAKILCLSEDRFGHLFREGVGQAPLQYINEVRLRKAMILLKTEEYTVTEVAEAVGFYDYNHFGRLFRKQFGCTPNQVRQGKIQPEAR